MPKTSHLFLTLPSIIAAALFISGTAYVAEREAPGLVAALSFVFSFGVLSIARLLSMPLRKSSGN